MWPFRDFADAVFDSSVNSGSFLSLLQQTPDTFAESCDSDFHASLVPTEFRLFKCPSAKNLLQISDNLLWTQPQTKGRVWSFLSRSYHFQKITVTSLCIAAAGLGRLWSHLIWILQGEKEHRVFDLQGETRSADGLKWRSWRLSDRMGADEAELS